MGEGNELALPQRSSVRRERPRRSARDAEEADLAVLQRVLDGLQPLGLADDGGTVSGSTSDGASETDGPSADGPSATGVVAPSSFGPSAQPLTQHWPDLRLAAMTLPGTVAAVPLARHRVRDWCGAWSVPSGVTDDMLMVVAELVGNAVVHGCGPVGMVVGLVEGGDRLVVDVYDAAPPNTVLTQAIEEAADGGTPAPTGDPLLLMGLDGDALADGLGADDFGEDFADFEALATSGRGLALVAAVSEDLRMLPHQRTGKTVRAVLDAG